MSAELISRFVCAGWRVFNRIGGLTTFSAVAAGSAIGWRTCGDGRRGLRWRGRRCAWRASGPCRPARPGGQPSTCGSRRPFEERGYPEIGVELFEVQAQAGWSEFHVAELRGGRAFQALGIFRREEDAETVGEPDDYTSGFAVVAGLGCIGGAGAERVHVLARFFEFLLSDRHVSPSMPRRVRRRAVRVSPGRASVRSD